MKFQDKGHIVIMIAILLFLDIAIVTHAQYYIHMCNPLHACIIIIELIYK